MRSFAWGGRVHRLSNDYEGRAMYSESHIYHATICRMPHRISTDLSAQVAA